jgi:hypothetical protein
MAKMTLDLNGDPISSNKPTATKIVDKQGRTLTIQDPTIMWESRLVRMLGESASNAAYMTAYALPAVMVVDIDGEPIPFPSNQIQLDSLIQQLGREGMGAVMDHLIATAEAAKAGGEAAATVKK